MSDIWRLNRDRRIARRKVRLMSHAENVWRAEIERLRKALRKIAEDKPYRDRPDDYRHIAAAALGFEDKWDNE